MKLTDPIKSSTVNRLTVRLAVLGACVFGLALVLMLADQKLARPLLVAGLLIFMCGYWIDWYISPDVDRDERAIAANEAATEGQPLERVGTPRWAFIALGLCVFVGFPLLVLLDELGS
ncbi:MAG: hypothetical protein JHD02_09495 [Thermoleophilaceae bacterium]|nr:hypothetical protein [Thermoleophilaceae bacterium]